jgi:hypothetical protein
VENTIIVCVMIAFSGNTVENTIIVCVLKKLRVLSI